MTSFRRLFPTVADDEWRVQHPALDLIFCQFHAVIHCYQTRFQWPSTTCLLVLALNQSRPTTSTQMTFSNVGWLALSSHSPLFNHVDSYSIVEHGHMQQDWARHQNRQNMPE